MARRRTELQNLLEETLRSQNVYFQPPPNLQLKYPCIVYSRDRNWDIWADDKKYLFYKGYSMIYITKTPDDPRVDRLELLPMCSFDRYYVSDNLNHYAFTIYF